MRRTMVIKALETILLLNLFKILLKIGKLTGCREKK
jgi:hypothetical protein